MFGNKSGANDKKEKEREAEARKVEAITKSIRAAVDGMQPFAIAPSPDRCEAAAKRVAELLKNPKAPKDFVKEMRDRSDELLRNCFMKAANDASHDALAAAHHDNKELRTKKIGEAKKLLARAVQLKAPPEFKHACDRAIEAATMTGFVHHDGPTKAKPADFAPKPLNRAKGDVPMKFEKEQADAQAEGDAPRKTGAQTGHLAR
jgi:hypothetical protein